MATTISTCLTSSSLLLKARPNSSLEPSSSFPPFIQFGRRKLQCFLPHAISFPHTYIYFSSASSSSPLLLNPTDKTKLSSAFALLEEEAAATAGETDSEDGLAFKNLVTSCKLYVCNIPRSCDISELLDMFRPFGTVLAVEVSRDSETGLSRGCGYVTMSSIDEAKAAIVALDGSDVGGREMRVRFSIEMNRGRSNIETLDLETKKTLIFESPYKIYVGNLAWSMKPSDLRYLFSQFGTVVSATVVLNHKAGRRRNYWFISFSSSSERDAAISLNGTELCGRNLIIREVLKQK